MNIFNKDQPFEFGKAAFPNGGRYGPVTHEHLDITVILQGEATVVVDKTEHHCVAGHAVFSYSEQRYEMTFPTGTGHYVCWCHTGELSMPQQSKTWLKSIPHSIPTSKLISLLIDAGIALGHGESVSLDRLRNSMGEAVFNEYFYRANLEEEDSRYPRAVARAKRYIDNNFTRPCSLHAIADFANLNPRYLLRLFKQYTGITPTRYLWRLRAEKGVYLLHQSKLNIKQITEQCGFQSPHHFSRYIKEHYGKSPSELRSQTESRDPHQFNTDVPDIRY